ncbi:MAG: hypothetical protein AAGE93_18005, partial [Bacteroidota bacterium]
IESALYIVNMLNGLITYHQAFHDGIKKFERSMNYSESEIRHWQQQAGLQPHRSVWMRTIPGHAQIVAKKI